MSNAFPSHGPGESGEPGQPGESGKAREAGDLSPSPAVEEPARRSGEHWTLLGLSGIGVVVLLVLGLFVEPDPRGFGTHEKLGLKPCLPMERWNVPCPGCGVTTSVTHAAHGELLRSLAVQPFGLFLSLVTVLFFVWGVGQHLRGRDVWIIVNTWDVPRLAMAGIVVLVLAWAYKFAAVQGVF